MLEKIKDLGNQVANKANDTVGGIANSVRGGVESLSNSASNLTDAINEKTVRLATAQMCSILEVALEELKTRKLSEHPVSLTATVNVGITALEMQIHLDPVTPEQPVATDTLTPTSQQG